MKCEDYRARLPEYWEGALVDEERADLEMHLAACAACRGEARSLGEIWRGLGNIPEAQPPSDLRRRFYERLESYQQGALETPPGPSWAARLRSWLPTHPAWQIGLAAAMLVVGFFAGYQMDNRRDAAQVSQLRAEVNNMRQLVTLSLLQQQNASERLRGVTYAYRMAESDTEVLSALLETINHDPNVNVRLAAVDALHGFSGSPVARRGLIQSLSRQESPLVQVSLIDTLAEMKDEQAVPALRTLAGDQAANPQVRQRAEWALGRLSH
ncbi:MAG: HEAT repeat domain-containing protein [Acidobacteria bacterium]|nr:HEAT repeat domain-containing protein [Acidobacteriota bacterium]